MSIVRVKHETKYLVINKTALEDPRLSFKAKGLWAYCMSRPDNWEFSVSHLCTVSKEKEDAIYSAFKELIEFGYCQRVQSNEGRGKGKGRGCFGKMDYEVYEEPYQIKNNFTQPDFPSTEVSSAGNPVLLSKDTKQVKKKKNPPLTPPKPKQPERPPTKEEWRKRISPEWTDQEFEYAWKKLQQTKGTIFKVQSWLEATMQDYRNAQGFSSGDRISRHREQASRYAGSKINKAFVDVYEDRVEFTNGTYFKAVSFDLSDEEWIKETKNWFKHEN